MLVVLLSHHRVFKELLTPAFVHVIIQRHEFTLTTGGVSNDKENKKVENHKVISLNADPCSSAFFPQTTFFFQRKKKLKASCDLSLRSNGCLSFFFSFLNYFQFDAAASGLANLGLVQDYRGSQERRDLCDLNTADFLQTFFSLFLSPKPPIN